MIHVVDNKKLEMSSDEWDLYQKIVQSYTNGLQKGEDMFIGLFETSDDGIITLLKPPSKKRTTMEVFLFLVSLQQQQHLRIMYMHVDQVCDEMMKKIGQ